MKDLEKWGEQLDGQIEAYEKSIGRMEGQLEELYRVDAVVREHL